MEGDEPVQMGKVRVTGVFSDEWSGKVILTSLLAAALLLCHGLFGASHQVFSALHAEHTSHGLSSHAHTPHTDSHGAVVGDQAPVQHHGDDGEGHLGHVAYAAALLVVSLGAVLWLLGAGRPWTRSGDLSSLTKRIVPPGGPLRPPPRSSPALLQVFRL